MTDAITAIAELEHWHPVALSDALGSEPLGVRLLDQELVVYRTASGRVAALGDVCPHRRMRLSLGHVRGERLVCKYHGWSFARDGSGESHGLPKRHACATALEAVERHGAVWVRTRNAPSRFPAFDTDGFDPIAPLVHTVQAPLEVVLDNFIEVEHTGTTHAALGYDPDRMNEVQTHVEIDAASFSVHNVGPQKPLSWALRTLFGVKPGDLFIDDWTTHFSPVHAVYDHFWRDPKTQARRNDHLRTYVFFVPEDATTTRLFSFIFARSRHPLRSYFIPSLGPVISWIADREVNLDRAMIENLADKSPDLKGMRLGRFDRPLGEARKRLASIYRTAPSATLGDANTEA